MLVITGSHTSLIAWGHGGVGLGRVQNSGCQNRWLRPFAWTPGLLTTARLFLHLYFHSSSLPLNLNSPDSFCLYLLLRML